MPVQAIPLALAASLYPLGIAALLLLTEAVRARSKVAVFLAGAVACTLPIGFLVVFALHGIGLDQDSKRSASFGLRLAIGVVLLVAALVIARWSPKPHNKPSHVIRLAREGGLVGVFVAAVALYVLPSPVYLAALEVVGSTKLDTAARAGWVIIVVALVLVTVEVPVLLFLLAPGRTVPRLRALDASLGRYARTLLAMVLAVIGLWEVIDGLVGLL